jgi:hypothetical protein
MASHSLTGRTTKHQVSVEPVPHNKGMWLTQDELNNHKIESYAKGKDSVFQEVRRIENKNISSAKVFCETLYNALNESKITCKLLHLKEEDMFNFSSIAVISEDDFLTPSSFRTAFAIASSISEDASKVGIQLVFNFMADDKNINYKVLISDQFKYSFGILKKRSKAVKNG